MDFQRFILKVFVAAVAVFGATGQPRALASGPGDFNGDGRVDLSDYGAFLGCFTGPGIGFVTSRCQTFDFDGDLDIDLIDWGGFQAAFTGSSLKRIPTVSDWGMLGLMLLLLTAITLKFGRRQTLPESVGP